MTEIDIIKNLTKDILILVGRLVFEDPDTMAHETREVVERWKDRVINK